MTDLATTQRVTAQILIGAGSDLLKSTLGTLPAEMRLLYATRAWSSWATACAAMAELEPLMPRTVAAGYDRHDGIVQVRAQVDARNG